ncbi:hypothetical protein [Streptomyces sp. NBC_01422]|uniref:hypothetical protein n=1 Tax=Streptomyces sp. NBC_01422 TaxID=2903859 RepID=UPI002E2A3846|nr:hypothetical protein [Streptomyces sp. NBC_01422]
MTDAQLTPDREQEIRTLDLLQLMSDRAAPVISGHLAALLGEVDRLRAQVAELEAAGSRLAAVEMLVEEARDKCNHAVDTDLLLDALGMEN